MKKISWVVTLCLGATVRAASAECAVVGYTEEGQEIVQCTDDQFITAPICDPRIAGDCQGQEIPNPRPNADPRERLPLQGGVPDRGAGAPPFDSAGAAPRNAAGGAAGLRR